MLVLPCESLYNRRRIRFAMGVSHAGVDEFALVLADGFPRSEVSPQDDRQRWAIEEGLRRIDPLQAQWRGVEARKDHTCVRGCAIKDGNVY